MASDSDSPFGPVIFSYSRAEALSDGVLIDVSALARDAEARQEERAAEALEAVDRVAVAALGARQRDAAVAR